MANQRRAPGSAPLRCSTPAFSGQLGFTKTVTDLRAGNPYFSPEMVVILSWVNIGAFLSSLPVAFGLHQPVGAILN